MKIENFAVISNTLQDVFNRIVYDELATLNGCFTLSEFETAIVPFIKNRNIDVFLFDSSSVKTNKDLVDAICFLRTISDDMRIVLVAPGLKDEKTLSAIVALGVYDIINPDVSRDEGIRFTETLVNNINHAVTNPKSFAMVAKMLKIQSEPSHSVEDNPSVVEVDRKLRTYLVYKDKKKYAAIIKEFENNSKFNIVGSCLNSNKAISELNLLKIDLLIIEEPSEDDAVELLNVVKVLKNKVKVVGFFADFESYEAISSVPELSTVVYSGDASDLSRVLTSFLVAKTRQITQSAFEGRSRVVAIVGQKGGVGRSTLSVLLADMFAKKSKLDLKVCVVDFNVFAGDIAVKYGITTPLPNFYVWMKDVMQQKRDNYDVNLMRGQITNYVHYISKQNVYVLPNTYTDLYDFVDFPSFSFEEINFALEYTIDALREQFDIVILDTTGYGPNVDVAIMKASNVFIVSDSSISGIYQSKSLYSRLASSSAINKDNIRMIVNEPTPNKKYKVKNMKLVKEFFENKTYQVSFDANLLSEFEAMKIMPSKKLVIELKPICDSVVPVFKKKK